MTATALGTKAGSGWSIRESKAVQADLGRLENRTGGALTRAAQAQLRVLPDVLGQVLDRPVGLPAPAQVGGFLAGQQHDLGLDVGAIHAGRGAVGAVPPASQAAGRGAGAPVPDGVTG